MLSTRQVSIANLTVKEYSLVNISRQTCEYENIFSYKSALRGIILKYKIPNPHLLISQNGVGPKHGSLTQPERCKINNLFIPNHKEKSMMRFDCKFFCGSFSRDGKHFVTANQGRFTLSTLSPVSLYVYFLSRSHDSTV
jgi:hypothetical protein